MAVNPLSRREVLKFGAYTTVGGVLTPGILLAQAVVTDTKGITARDEQIESGGTKIPIYHAGPEKMAKYPVIVVISGFTGNSEQNKDVCRRFAHAGYYAIAPELYSREGGMQGKDFQQMGAISSKVTRAQYLGDIKAAADYARQQRWARSEEHTSELQSPCNLVCRLLLEKNKTALTHVACADAAALQPPPPHR